MIVFFKILLSLGVAMAWYHLTSNQEVATIFFVLMLIIFFIRPIPYQTPTERQEYIDKMRRARERQASIEEERRREKKKALEEKNKRTKKEDSDG
ncbi:MAG: hypothetical protein J1E31_03235 [Helicobacter sp.]|nr:hypothetical protein [Helicobacter sp.]